MWFRRPSKIDISQFTPIPADGYLIGGAVRDLLLGREVSDIDWLVADAEAEARATADLLGAAVFPLDENRGHWRVVLSEVTRDYIALQTELEPNLAERDFTINAMAISSRGELIDPMAGHKDLQQKTLRMVSEDNLRSDPLRLLRAVRIACQIEFRIEPQTEQTIREVARDQLENRIGIPAWERVRQELDKIMLTERAGQGFQALAELGLLQVYLPELAAAKDVQQGGFHHLDVLGHSLEALQQLVQGFADADLALRWATLLHDVAKPETKTYDGSRRYYHFYGHDKRGAELTRHILLRLRHSTELADYAAKLVRYHMLQLPRDDKAARRFAHRRRDILPDLLKLMIADREAARGPLSSPASRQAYRLALARVLSIMEESPTPVALLSGHEVMQLLNLAPGPRVGKALRFLAEAQAVADVASLDEAKEALLQFAKGQGWQDA